MRQFAIDRNAMRSACPEIVRAYDTDLDPASDVSYFLAVAILPGCEAIPMEVEADPEAIRQWMERSLLMQARGYAPGRPGRTRAIRGHVPVPASVVALMHMLAHDESAHDPAPATLGRRFALRWADPARDPAPGHAPPAPAPAPRPFR